MNVKSYTLISEPYNSASTAETRVAFFQLVKAFFKTISGYRNIAIGDITESTTNCYAYFTVTDSIDASVTYRFCLNSAYSGLTLVAGIAPNQTGGNMSNYKQDINAGSYTKYKEYGGKMYSHCRIFYDDDNNFLGTTGLYGENFSSPWWFAILHDISGTPVWLRQGTSGSNEITTVYDLTQTSSRGNLFAETTLSTNNETPDTVYIDVPDYTLPDVYRIYNNTFFYLQNTTRVCKALLFINTQAGQFISLRANIWFKIDNVGENTTVIYNG